MQVVKCPVKDCGKEFQGKAGLSSHLRNQHGAQASKADYVASAVIPAPEPAQSEIAKTESLDARYRKLWAKGNYRCLECADQGKRISFNSPKDLGRHRRFSHGVKGKNADKNAASWRRRQENPLAISLDTPGSFSCSHCPRTFTTTRGLNVHLGTIHQGAPNGESPAIVHIPPKELSNGKVAGNRDAAPDHAAFVEALAIANATGFVQSYFSTVANEHDLSTRQFARRCLVTLSKYYS